MQTRAKLATAAAYRERVERTVADYCKTVAPVARGSKYMEVLKRNTDRLHGSLVLAGYDLQGGEDQHMIQRAALAIELLHAYVACTEQGIDEVQALRAMHEAQIILANLETEEENRLKALSITNRTLMLANLARLPETPKADTLHYRATELALNPLHVGQVLASADCHATNAITPAAITFGKSLANGEEAGIEVYLSKVRDTVR